MYTFSEAAKKKLRSYLDFRDMKDIDESYISQKGKEFEICGYIRDILTHYYHKLCKIHKLSILTGVTISIHELFGNNLSLFTPLAVFLLDGYQQKQNHFKRNKNLQSYDTMPRSL